VEFSAEHRFPAAPDAVASVLADRAFYEDLELPDLSLDAVVHAGQGETAGERTLILRYEYTGNLDPMARRLLGGERLTWTQEVRLRATGPKAGDAAPGSVDGVLVFRAEANPDLLHGDARFTLVADRDATVRRLEGELVVALPVIGRMAEQRIVPGVLNRLDVEAAAVERRLVTSGGS
jgi:Protein of unknown function (DUF2505)